MSGVHSGQISALACVTSPGKFLINTTIQPPSPSIVYRNLPVLTLWVSHPEQPWSLEPPIKGRNPGTWQLMSLFVETC
jgi:hypothetical protein